MNQLHSLPTRSSLRQGTSGFTLLEVSIVLAIIGLLAGGILAGKTFITNSRLNTLMSESRYYINAFNEFNTQGKGVPGDFHKASEWWPDFKKTDGTLGAHNGDGNRFIRAGAVVQNNEIFVAFEHLALAGLITGSYTGSTTGTAGTTAATIGTNIPKSVMENVGYIFNHPDDEDGDVINDPVYFDGQYGHVLIIAGATAGSLPNTGFLPPTQALQIDDKYDDGAPGTGWITTYKPATPTSTADCASTNNTATAAFNVQLKTKPCYLILNIAGS